MAGDERLSLPSGLWRNTDGTLPRSARSNATLASAPFPELPGREGEQATSARTASIVSAHTTDQIVSTVTLLTADQPAAVAVAMAVVSDALGLPVTAPTR